MKTSTFAARYDDVRAALDSVIARAVEEAWPAFAAACERAMSDNTLKPGMTLSVPVECEGQVLTLGPALCGIAEKRVTKSATAGESIDLLQQRLGLPEGGEG